MKRVQLRLKTFLAALSEVPDSNKTTMVLGFLSFNPNRSGPSFLQLTPSLSPEAFPSGNQKGEGLANQTPFSYFGKIDSTGFMPKMNGGRGWGPPVSPERPTYGLF
jgi:hypothetical protein